MSPTSCQLLHPASESASIAWIGAVGSGHAKLPGCRPPGLRSVPVVDKASTPGYVPKPVLLRQRCKHMSNGEFFLAIGSIVILTVAVFWSHFEAEAARVRRQAGK